MPLTDNGLVMPEDDDIIAQQKQNLKTLFGDDIDTNPASIFGRIAIYAQQNWDVINQKQQQTYDGSNPATATGIQLDRQAANAGIQRNDSQYAQVQLVVTGTPGYVIQEGTNFETNNGDVFTTVDDVQIPDAPKDQTDGTVTVDAMSQYAAASENVGANTIVNQSEPVDDIDSVNNPSPAYNGADLETDYDLRTRIRQNLLAKPGPQPEGLRTALLNINGVTGVHMQCNTSDQQADSFGNPPHSVHFYVSGGEPNDIFQTLADNAAYGTTFTCDQENHKQSKVNTSHIQDVDIDGSKFHISYDDAEPQNLYFYVYIQKGNDFDQDAVKQSIDDFLSDFDMGNEIVLNKLYQYLYELDGVNQVTDLMFSPDKEHWTTKGIKLHDFQIASVNNDDTNILINPTYTDSKGNKEIYKPSNITNNEIDDNGVTVND